MIKQLFEVLYNWVFPTKCILCNNTDIFVAGVFCSECFAKITVIEEPICIKCGKLFTVGMPINSLCNECSSSNNSQCCTNIIETVDNKNEINNIKDCEQCYNVKEYNNKTQEFINNNSYNKTDESINNNDNKKITLSSKLDYKEKYHSTISNSYRLFEEARSLFLYDIFAKKIIMEIKANANSNVANACCRLLFNKYPTLFENIDYIVPVPSHWSRTLYRGFNPVDIIVRELSIISGIKVNKSLKRIRHTAYQHKKTKAERLMHLLVIIVVYKIKMYY